MLSEIILLAALVSLAVYLIKSKPSARHLAVRRIFLFVAILGGIAVVIAPGWLTAISSAVGIGRGPDLLLYALIIVFLLNVISDHKRTVELTRANTRLARAITLSEARIEDLIKKQNC